MSNNQTIGLLDEKFIIKIR